MAHEIFVSYGHEDKAVADAVCARFEGRGIRCWIAPRDVLPGHSYGDAIATAIRDSKALVLVFSSNANLSKHVSMEVERAVSRGIPVVPLRIEEVAPSNALDYFLGSVHWLDAMTPPLERHLDRLVDSVGRLISDSEYASPRPAVPITALPRGMTRLKFMLLAVIVLVAIAAWQVTSLLRRDSAAILGCWSWPGGATLRMERDGRVIGMLPVGQWLSVEGDRYTIQWPLFEDAVVLSADGLQLSGQNNWGHPVGGTREATANGPSLSGNWLYNGIPTVIRDDGSVLAGAFNGTWTTQESRAFKIVWTHRIVDDFSISASGNLLRGSNNFGGELEASRTTCPS